MQRETRRRFIWLKVQFCCKCCPFSAADPQVVAHGVVSSRSSVRQCESQLAQQDSVRQAFGATAA